VKIAGQTLLISSTDAQHWYCQVRGLTDVQSAVFIAMQHLVTIVSIDVFLNRQISFQNQAQWLS